MQLGVLPVLLSLFWLPAVLSYSRGAPMHACRDGHPKHGSEPQDSPAPYTVTVEKVSTDPDKVKAIVTLSGAAADDVFRGFLVQARDPEDQRQFVGSFSDLPADTSAVSCSRDFPTASVTHTDAELKEKVVLTWEAPEGYRRKVAFRAAFVLTQSIYWVDVEATLETAPDKATTENPATLAAEPEAEGETSSADLMSKNTVVHLLVSLLWSAVISIIMEI